MKGLKKYIDNHGFHFTEALAYKIVGTPHWSYKDLLELLRGRVYYNVSGCTPGDIVYIVNTSGFKTKKKVLRYMLNHIMYNVGLSDRTFHAWVVRNRNTDISSYI